MQEGLRETGSRAQCFRIRGFWGLGLRVLSFRHSVGGLEF